MAHAQRRQPERDRPVNIAPDPAFARLHRGQQDPPGHLSRRSANEAFAALGKVFRPVTREQAGHPRQAQQPVSGQDQRPSERGIRRAGDGFDLRYHTFAQREAALPVRHHRPVGDDQNPARAGQFGDDQVPGNPAQAGHGLQQERRGGDRYRRRGHGGKVRVRCGLG
jgi:hypothetical protein